MTFPWSPSGGPGSVGAFAGFSAALSAAPQPCRRWLVVVSCRRGLAIVSAASLSEAVAASVLVLSAVASAVPAASGGVAAAVHPDEVELVVLLVALVESPRYQNQRP